MADGVGLYSTRVEDSLFSGGMVSDCSRRGLWRREQYCGRWSEGLVTGLMVISRDHKCGGVTVMGRRGGGQGGQ